MWQKAELRFIKKAENHWIPLFCIQWSLFDIVRGEKILIDDKIANIVIPCGEVADNYAIVKIDDVEQKHYGYKALKIIGDGDNIGWIIDKAIHIEYAIEQIKNNKVELFDEKHATHIIQQCYNKCYVYFTEERRCNNLCGDGDTTVLNNEYKCGCGQGVMHRIPYLHDNKIIISYKIP